MLNAILIDDERHCLRLLNYTLQQMCPNVTVVAECQSGEKGIAAIAELQPDLIFLDIEMRDMTGFEMLERIKDTINFEIIFTTAYDEFALDAFKVSAVDYLLKPIDEEDLQKAVAKVNKKIEERISSKQVSFLLQQLKKNRQDEQEVLALPSQGGLEFVEIQDIIYCQSERNYTHVYFVKDKPMLISKTLKDIDALLPSQQFFRVHHSYTVNLKHIKRYLKIDGGYLVMSNGDQVKVSRSKKELLLTKF